MLLAFVFDSIGVGEWFVLLAVILIVVGPKRLPSAARKFGAQYAKFRRAAENFKRQLLDMDGGFGQTVSDMRAAYDAAEREVRDVAQAAEQVVADSVPETPPSETAVAETPPVAPSETAPQDGKAAV